MFEVYEQKYSYSHFMSIALSTKHIKEKSPIIYRLCLVWLYHICPHYLIEQIFIKKIIDLEHSAWFCVQPLSENVFSKKI